MKQKELERLAKASEKMPPLKWNKTLNKLLDEDKLTNENLVSIWEMTTPREDQIAYYEGKK
jgi:hypothetical protein